MSTCQGAGRRLLLIFASIAFPAHIRHRAFVIKASLNGCAHASGDHVVHDADDRGADQDNEQNREDEDDHRHGERCRQSCGLFFSAQQTLIAKLIGEHTQGLG